ncbi:Major Facilitator Superfamily protein [Paenibacillus sp. OK003]|nr:Major Facilitator Superfamily protein [Paenibacillus sp. OK003]
MDFSWKRNLVILWMGVFFCSTAYSISIPFLPLFLSGDLGVRDHLEFWSGLAFGITFLASALVSPFWGSLADKYGRKPLWRNGPDLSRSCRDQANLWQSNQKRQNNKWLIGYQRGDGTVEIR